MRLFPLSAAFLAAACSTPPRAELPPPVPPPSATAARPSASSAPTADEGPPPDPPMAMRWTFRLPAVAGQPGTVQRFAVFEGGDATWESVRAGGDGEVDEELSSAPARALEGERCRGHLGPARHRKLVVAARRAMASGCGQATAADRLGRPADGAAATIAVTWAGEIKSCDVGRSGGSYAAFEEARAEAVAAICARR